MCTCNGKHLGIYGSPYLFESSAIPARALYQARKAANSAKKPPALIMEAFGMPFASRWRYPIPSSMNAISSEKNSEKNATVERRVHSTRIVVKMNQPC